MTTTGSTAQTLDTTWPRETVSVRTRAEQLVLTSYERSALTLEEYAERVIAFAESSAEVARRASVARRVALLRDSWGPLLKASLENWLTPPVLEAVLGENKDHIDLSRNPAKSIWQELAVTYKRPPKRTTPEDPGDVKKYLALLDGTQFDLFWQIVEVMLQACNEVLVWPDVITRRIGGETVKHLKHRYATGDAVTLIGTDQDATEIEGVCVIDNFVSLAGERHRVYRLWTNEWFAEFEKSKDGEIRRVGYVDPDLQPEEDNGAANPYGRLPMILIRRWPWGETLWDQTSGEDLVDLTIRGGEERALYRYMQKMSGFKQLAVAGLSIEQAPQQLMDPAAVARFETDGALTVIDWTVPLKDRLECMMIDELAAAASHGINPERYKRTASYQTSFGARLAERGLAEERTRIAPILALAEQRYKEHVCLVCEAHGMENVPDPSVKLEVIYAPMAYPEDPAQQMAVEEKEIALGLESPVSLIERRHPEWDDEQAKEALERNMEAIAWMNDMKASRNIPAVPSNDSRSAEVNGAQGPVVRDGNPPAGSPPDTNGDKGVPNDR